MIWLILVVPSAWPVISKLYTSLLKRLMSLVYLSELFIPRQPKWVLSAEEGEGSDYPRTDVAKVRYEFVWLPSVI